MLSLILAAQVTCVPYLGHQSLCRWDDGRFQVVANRDLVLPKPHSWGRRVIYASLIGSVALIATHTSVDVHFKHVTARQ